MATIRPNDLPAAASVPGVSAIIVDTGSAVEKATPAQIVDSATPLASQAEAEAGSDNAKRVTPLRVAQAIEALGVSAARLSSNTAGQGASLVGLEAGGTIEEAVKIVTPLQFGAVGDFDADDTVAIQAALDTGADVQFPAGYTFKTSGLLQVTTDFQRIIIDGTVKYDGERRFIATDVYGFQGLFQVQDQVEGVTFTGSGIMDGNWRRAGPDVSQPLQARDAGSGIYAYRAIGLKVDGITFQHFSENGLKTMNCPALIVTSTCTFFDICNIGVEIYSYVNDTRTGVPWVGTVFPPSGSIDGFYDWIDDGEFFANFGNGVGVSFQSAPGALPVRNLRVGGQFRDCLAAIWSENNSSEAINIVIDSPRIEGNYRGAGTASSLQGIGLIRVKNSQVISPVIYNVGNVAPASGSQSAGLHIVECDGISIINPTIIDDTGDAERTQFGIRVNAGTNIQIRGGAIEGTSGNKIERVNSPTNVRVENVRGSDPADTWGNLTKFTFALQNIGASTTAKMLVVGETGAEAACVPCGGRPVAMSIRAADGQAFVGSYYFWARVNGVEETGLRCTSSGASGTQANFATVDGSSQAVSAQSTEDASQCATGDRLSVLVTTDGSWNPAHEAYADLWFDLGMRA